LRLIRRSYTRSVVPSKTEEAINKLKHLLEEKSIILSEVLSIPTYDSRTWNSEEDEGFETVYSFENSKTTGETSIGCVVPELSMED
jgi:NADH:ubiquinone oxidoreductase subunit C